MKIRDIIKTENIIKVTSDDTLSFVAGKLSSAHDSAFVFNEKDKYLGVINPYYCFVKTIYPAHTKTATCMFHAPKIKCSDYPSRAAKLMIESKIHYLPVFDNNKFAGIITARRLIEAGIKQGLYNIQISQLLKSKKPVVTINEQANLGQALQSFKENKVSKLVVIESGGRLRGVLSYFDLIPLFIEPREKLSYMARIGEKNSLNQKKIRNYFKTLVLTIKTQEPLKKAALLVLDREIGSVLIIDSSQRPIGIITTKDLLLHWIKPITQKIEVIKHYQDLNNQQKKQIEILAEELVKLLNKKNIKIDTIIIKIDKAKNTFQISLDFISKKNNVFFVKKDDIDINRLLSKTKKTVNNILSNSKKKSKKK